jgi:hypothetical protein
MATSQLATDIFFRAFKDCVSNIIKNLPISLVDDPTISNAIQIIAIQLNGEFMRLQYVVEVIQGRLSEDPAWASTTAVKVYELLAMYISPTFSHPEPRLSERQGAALVRSQMLEACQSQFDQTMTEVDWSRGLIAFLGQLCAIGNNRSTTTGITLHVIDCMMVSLSLNPNNSNFDIFLGYMMRAGPFLDSHGSRAQGQLTERMEQLKEKAKALRTTEWLAVYGILQLRDRGWRMEEADVMTS